jgi:hypothetical protein
MRHGAALEARLDLQPVQHYCKPFPPCRNHKKDGLSRLELSERFARSGW